MDREILFRGKDVDNNKWVYGSYFAHQKVNLCIITRDDEVKNNTQHLIVQDRVAGDWNFENGIQVVDVKPETVGQYTGLKDKNGTKIFEGDILHLKTGKGWFCGEGVDIYYKVIFTQFNEECHTFTEYIGYMAEDKYGNLYSIEYIIESEDAKVIGNIYDNPEILGEDNGN